jgi:hypothetical protein
MIYTQRRTNSQTHKLAWVHGTAIGVASSDDGGLSWKYHGTLDLEFEPGHNTFWASEVYWKGEKYQFFVSYVQGIPDQDFNHIHKDARFEGADMWDLSFTNFLQLDAERVIDPSIIKLLHGKP